MYTYILNSFEKWRAHPTLTIVNYGKSDGRDPPAISSRQKIDIALYTVCIPITIDRDGSYTFDMNSNGPHTHFDVICEIIPPFDKKWVFRLQHNNSCSTEYFETTEASKLPTICLLWDRKWKIHMKPLVFRDWPNRPTFKAIVAILSTELIEQLRVKQINAR